MCIITLLQQKAVFVMRHPLLQKKLAVSIMAFFSKNVKTKKHKNTEINFRLNSSRRHRGEHDKTKYKIPSNIDR